MIFAYTSSPHGRLNGAAFNTDTGTVQEVDETISDKDPSQWTSSVE